MSDAESAAAEELPGIPAGWSVRRFGSLFAVQQGKQVSRNSSHDGAKRPFLRARNVMWGHIDLTELDEMYFTEPEELRLALQIGDLLVCEGGEIGRSAVWRGGVERCYFQNHIHRARLSDDATDADFVLFWLWYAFAVGRVYFGRGNVTTIPNLSQSRLCELPIPAPSLGEQRRIANALKVVRHAIAEEQNLARCNEELKEALQDHLFRHGLRREPKRETEMGFVPETWAISRLDEFCVLQRGFDITKKEQRPGAVPVVSSGGIFSHHAEAKVGGPGVVVGRKGTLGTVHYVDVDFWPHDTTLWVKDFKGNDERFAAYLLKRLRFERFDSGVSNPTLNRNTIHGELVAYPPTEEQKQIAHILATADEKTRLHEDRAAALRALFRTLLHELMTGKLRVPVRAGEKVEAVALAAVE